MIEEEYLARKYCEFKAYWYCTAAWRQHALSLWLDSRRLGALAGVYRAQNVETSYLATLNPL